MAKVLVTGARGFVGQALMRRLAEEDVDVVATSRSVDPAISSHRVTWLPLDLMTETEADLSRAVEHHGITHCIHAAWYTDHADYLVAEINREWVVASERLARAIGSGGGRRLVALGTCLEYDQAGLTGPCNEDRTPLRPETLYARCKGQLRQSLNEIAQQQGLSLAWARVFFVYGPHDRAGRLIPYVTDSVRHGRSVAPRFGGLRRDYIHVDDLAAQLVALALNDATGSFNTASGRALSLSEIFRVAGEVAGRPDLVESNDLVDPQQSPVIEADMSKFERLVGPALSRPLAEGLRDLMSCQQ